MSAVAKAESIDGGRCWPHHFDVGILKGYGKNSKDEDLWIGAGLSPGDDNYQTPYYYTNPYPAGEATDLPSLERGGKWHTKGFISAVLCAEDITVAQDQGQFVSGYLEEAVSACKQRLNIDGGA